MNTQRFDSISTATKEEKREIVRTSFQNARAISEMSDRAFWQLIKESQASVVEPVQEHSPAEAYQRYLQTLEQAKTTVISPVSKTDEIDTKHMADVPTVIQPWEDFAIQAGLVPEAELECSPVTSERIPTVTESHPRVTKALSGKLENYLSHWIEYTYSGALELVPAIRDSVNAYTTVRKYPPLAISVSKEAYSVLQLTVPSDWIDAGYPGPHRSIEIAPHTQPTLSIRCWGN